ncbi:NHL repeat-containing protein [Streptomyces mayteni]
MIIERPRSTKRALLAAGAALLAALGGIAAAPPGAGGDGSHRPFLEPLKTITTIASTVPDNDDVNPYGVAVVPHDEGHLRRGHVLVSNFNNAANEQGTGTTLVQISPAGETSLFAEIDPTALPGACPGGVGLTTALSILPGGWVVVGSLPTADGTSATAQAGCLLVLDNKGEVRETFAGDGINGPWDMTAAPIDDHHVALFVTNVLNGTVAAGGAVVDEGTVLRITVELHDGKPPTREKTTVIGSGFPERTDPAALVVGPTGVGLGKDDVLYVADTVDNRIAAIPKALTRESSAGVGRTVTEGVLLNGPLGLAIAPNDDILTVNGGDGNIVETTPRGEQVAFRQLDASGDPPGAGALFGLAIAPDKRSVYFVDDAANTLDLLS